MNRQPPHHGGRRRRSPPQHGGDQRRNSEAVDRAVIKAHRDLIEAGENVSAWKVSQDALVMLKADSWDSLGLRMQQVPSLFNLIVTDGKINAFIHCFVAVQGITTLYDLEVAICRNEGVEQFEELELGPLVKHPLIIHYFSISPDVLEVFRITTVEIISFLAEYMDADEQLIKKKGRRVNIDEFLNFIAEKKSIGTTEKLGVRIQSLGMHITVIKQARQFKTSPVNKDLRTVKKESSKRGKHVRFISGSDYENSDDDQDESAAHSQSKFAVGNIESSDGPTTCPYPSASEEMTRLGLKTEVEVSLHTASGSDKNSEGIRQSNRKGKHDDVQSSLALPIRVPKRDVVQSKLFARRNKKETKFDKRCGDDSIKMFVNTWKEACRTNSVDEVSMPLLLISSNR